MAALVIIILALVPALGVVVLKDWDQRVLDKRRKTVVVHMPSDFKVDGVTAWLRSISGTLRYSNLGVSGAPTIAFETWSSMEGIKWRLRVPWTHEAFIIGQLRTLVPGIRVDEETDYRPRVWKHIVEVRLTHSSRPLRIFDPSNVAHSILSAATHDIHGEDEELLIQWVMTPAAPSRQPVHGETYTDRQTFKTIFGNELANRHEIRERREKLAEPNLMAVLRVAARANTKTRAIHLTYNIRQALSALRTNPSRFEKRLLPNSVLQHRVNDATGMVHYPIQLSAPEAAALIGWPINDPFVTGLPASLARVLPVPAVVPKVGRVIGKSNMPGAEGRTVAIPYEDATKHAQICAPTGAGKTVTMYNWARQDILNGYGVIVMETKGDLFDLLVNSIPKERFKDTVVINVPDRQWPVGFNILQQGNPEVVVDELGDLFDYLYRDSRGVWTQEALYFGLRTLITDRTCTFIDLIPLLTPTAAELEWAEALRDRASRQFPELKQFWQTFENLGRAGQDRFVQPLKDRVWQLTSRPQLRNILGQSESSFQMSDVIAGNKILLINLQNVPDKTVSLVGTLIMNAIWHAVRTTMPPKANYLYLDEFQRFVDLPLGAEQMFAQARSRRLGINAAHQHISQLPPDVRDAVLANARTKIYYQTEAPDSSTMARAFSNVLTAQDFERLGKFEGAAKIATGDGVSPPFTFRASPPAPGLGSRGQVINMARGAYGRHADDVQKQIDNRRHVIKDTSKQQRPRIGGWTEEQ